MQQQGPASALALFSSILRTRIQLHGSAASSSRRLLSSSSGNSTRGKQAGLKAAVPVGSSRGDEKAASKEAAAVLFGEMKVQAGAVAAAAAQVRVDREMALLVDVQKMKGKIKDNIGAFNEVFANNGKVAAAVANGNGLREEEPRACISQLKRLRKAQKQAIKASSATATKASGFDSKQEDEEYLKLCKYV
jgi:hypothetical protein